MNFRFLGFCLWLLCWHFSLWAQQNKTTKNHPNQQVKLFFEKVYVQTDRSYYSSGEDIWFSAFLVNGKSTSLTASSGTLYVELINPSAKLIDKKIIRLENGLGKGDFRLKDSIPSGWYNLRAYTNWMRNFGNHFVFEKAIYVSDHVNPSPQASKANNNKNNITFFPEGGDLVAGLGSLVAFKTQDSSGNGIMAKGSIISSKGDTITNFQSTEAGLGLFSFSPVAGESYRVVGNLGTEIFSSLLPEVLAKGINMHVTTDSLNIKVAVGINQAMLNEINGQNLTMVLKHCGEVVFNGQFKAIKTLASINIPTQNLPGGLAILTLIDGLGRPHCERLVYINKANKVKLAISMSKSAYGNREKVVLNLKSTDALGQAIPATCALSVVDGALPYDSENILSYLYLQSEIKGNIKNAAQYFDENNPSRLKQLDLLLLTQGWRNYVWRKLADSALKISYLPEPALSIKGMVREKLANKPLPNMNITLFGSGFSGDKLFTAKTDEKGQFFINGLKWYGNQPIKLSSQDNKGKKGGWLLLDSTVQPLPITLKINEASANPSVNTALAKRLNESFKYKFSDSILLQDVEIKAKANKAVTLFDETMMTFGYPEQVFDITPADYSFNGLEHFLITKAKGAYPVQDSISSEGVTFLAQGKQVRPRIIVNNREELVAERLDYYSLTLDQINQIRIQHLVSNNGSDVYVIRLNLKDSALRGPNLHLINTNLTGYYAAKNFYVPNYAQTNVNFKDLSSTVFWAPLVKTDKNGTATLSFFQNDLKGKMRINAAGISEKGNVLVAQSQYNVQ